MLEEIAQFLFNHQDCHIDFCSDNHGKMLCLSLYIWQPNDKDELFSCRWFVYSTLAKNMKWGNILNHLYQEAVTSN